MTELKHLPIFHKDAISSSSKAFMNDAESFRTTVFDQTL